MDTLLRDKITEKLTKFLNRPPTESEIINAQTDLHILGQIRDEEIIEQRIEIAKQKLEIAALKK